MARIVETWQVRTEQGRKVGQGRTIKNSIREKKERLLTCFACSPLVITSHALVDNSGCSDSE